MSLSVIFHKGTKILLIDYTQCKNTDEMLSLLSQAEDYYKKSNEQIRILSDFTNAFGSVEFMNESKRLKKEIGHKTHKSAILGISQLKEILLKGYNMVSKKKTIPFDSKEKALEYLIKD